MNETAPVDDFWTQDVFLFEGKFKCYRNESRPVRGKIHVSDEQYIDVNHEIVPIAKPRKGDRTYVMMHPYVVEPILTFSVALYPKPKQYADQNDVIGRTVGQPKQEGVRDVQIGDAQAWYYPADTLLVLWECFVWEDYRKHPFVEDPHMVAMWRSFEQWLSKQFPEAKKIATPFHDPIADSIEEYQQFLRALGYVPVAKTAFGKQLR